MNIKEKILIDINNLDNNPVALGQLFDMLQMFKNRNNSEIGNQEIISKFCGTLNSEDSLEISKAINEEFNSLEGEW